MLISLDRNQYIKLLYLIAIGEWVVNSYKDESEYEFTDIEQYIYSFYKDFGAYNLIDYDEEENIYFPTEEFENDFLTYVEEFLENNCDQEQTNFIGFN